MIIKFLLKKGGTVMLQHYLKNATYVVVLTGAGMSTESGVPDFRSAKGIWKDVNPMKLASTKALKHNKEAFYTFYKQRVEQLQGCAPNIGHTILVKWEEKGWIQSIITQNVDRFHQEAGSKRVHELHGDIRTLHCLTCQKTYQSDKYLEEEGQICTCGGFLRPNVVLFGEMLPIEAVEGATDDIMTCDLLIVLGSSLQVSPANSFVRDAHLNGAKVVVVNLGETAMDHYADEKIDFRISEVLRMTDQHMG